LYLAFGARQLSAAAWYTTLATRERARARSGMACRSRLS